MRDFSTPFILLMIVNRITTGHYIITFQVQHSADLYFQMVVMFTFMFSLGLASLWSECQVRWEFSASKPFPASSTLNIHRSQFGPLLLKKVFYPQFCFFQQKYVIKNWFSIFKKLETLNLLYYSVLYFYKHFVIISQDFLIHTSLINFFLILI